MRLPVWAILGQRGKSWRARVALCLCVVCATLLFRPYPAELLDPKRLASIRIVDREGRLLHEARSSEGGYGHWVPLAEVSPHVVLATLSAEDAHFRWHPGIDPIGVARALWLDTRLGRIAYGGSTITQQLAGLLDPRPRTLGGKLFEASDAVRLELSLSKDEILEQYLNRAYYGRKAHGIEAASRRFLGKSAAKLELHEAALLAILPRAPTAYDPARFPERARHRRAHVLRLLAERGWVDSAAAAEATSRPIELSTEIRTPRARHVLDALPSEALSGERAVVTSTIDLALEDRLRSRLREHLADLAGQNADQAAVVVLDNATGDVLAMVGSRDYEEAAAHGAVNATLARRPPGSTLKPFVYALAVERGAHASTPTLDVPTSWAGFQPRNARLDHHGLIGMGEALGSSLNLPAVRTASDESIGRLLALLSELDLVGAEASTQGLALALGSAPVRLVDLASAYATLARGGEHLPWRLFDPERPPPARRRVFDGATAFLITEMLADAGARRREFGVETPLELPFAAAVKTGTSKSFCDNFVVGYTPYVTVAVWVGNFDGRPMHGLLAMRGAAPLWRDAMLVSMERRPKHDFEPPSGVATAQVCPLSGQQRGASCPSVRQVHVDRDHMPAKSCTWHEPSGRVRVPAELRAFEPDSSDGVIPTTGPELEIAAPIDGARLVLDPLLPRSRQRLRLRALVRSANAERVRWEVDGRVIAEPGAPFTADWAIEPGEHRVRAVAFGDEKGAPRAVAAHEVRIVVSGESR